jgi:NAD(P)H-flavin reductase
MRAVIEEILLARLEWHKVMLFYGERTADRFALAEDRELWREANIEVYQSASRPSAGTSWLGHTGYVQDLILEMEPETSDTVVFVAGKDGMIEGVKSAFSRLNLPENRIILNT